MGLPSFPSGVRMILESCKEPNAPSEKIASFNFIFLTLKSKERKSLAIEEFLSAGTVLGAIGFDGEEIKVVILGDALIKKT